VQGYTVDNIISPITPPTVYLHPGGQHPCISPSKIYNHRYRKTKTRQAQK